MPRSLGSLISNGGVKYGVFMKHGFNLNLKSGYVFIECGA